MGAKSVPVEAIDASNSNPTRQQRAVYSWHEARNSDAADDIFSTEWFKRTKSFLEKHSNPDSPDVKLEDLKKVEDLEFSAFFIQHPIPAFALWQFLQACYSLDRVVCINPLSYEDIRRADETKVQGWEKLLPFQYLNASSSKDGRIRKKWIESMGQLKKEIESNALEGERLVSRLYDMYTGIDRLQSSLSGLRLGFGESQKDLKFKREMLDKAANVVEERLKITSTVLKLEGNQPATPRADWGAEEKHTHTEQNLQLTEVSRCRNETNPPPSQAMRLRKSNRRLKQPRAVSPKKVDPTTNPLQGQGSVTRNPMPLKVKYLITSLLAILALLLVLSFIYH
ncbi:uncharacterized protein K444DRAFT_662928 [Hyaloscypha bicolor E]|uniref:Uncharacterized protein n=1 Tax=Hyaloscypha bicolor E TaxID=1095630 RepID=A0A2J6TD84_9HELO|nr:uncharacterized protein K444DRAFT_662928 [Hyaloscypha bicolor E]PMD60962.1 hypothetical protein K444DRAFT_662928 [Hyaloscypha bicolor E]